MDFLITTINNLATLINEEGGPLGAAIGALAAALVGALIGGVVTAVGTFVGGVADKLSELIGSFASLFGGGSASEDETLPEEGSTASQLLNTLVTPGQAKARGKQIPQVVAEGIKENKKVLLDTVDTVGTEMTNKMNRSEDAKKAAQYTAEGFINHILEMLEEFRKTGIAAGEAFMDGFSSSGALDYASPSKATARAASYVVAGFVDTIKSSVPEIMSTGENMGSNFMSALAESIKISDGLLDSDLNPVITPVLDLSNVQSNSGYISKLLGDGASYDAALAINNNRLATAAALQNANTAVTQQQPTTINVDFHVDHVGGELTEADISRFGRQIADEVNYQLGKKIFGR